MTYTMALGKHNKYYRYGTYNDLQTAIRTARYFRAKNRKIRYKITEEWHNSRKTYGLWLTNYIRW